MKSSGKVHRFGDCINIPYRATANEYPVTDNIYKVTCGQCKGRILNKIRDLEWENLSLDEATVMDFFAVKIDKEV
jgi:hypothetical protein